MSDNIITKIHGTKTNEFNRILITSVNYEERCTGISSTLTNNFQFDDGIVFIFNEEKKDKVASNLKKLKEYLDDKGPKLCIIQSSQHNPYQDIENFYLQINKISSESIVFFDISTMPVKHMLLLLKTLEDLGLWKKIQIFYTEPEEYETKLYLPMSIGVGLFDTTGEFIGNASPSLPVLLIEFLGYERDRAKAVFDNIEPDETVLVIPRPAYRPEWDGKTEQFNNTLRKIVGTNDERHASAFDPHSVVLHLDKIKEKFAFKKYKWIIVPLGTKPQSLGIYLFWRKNPNLFSILFADPLFDNPAYYPKGIGKTRLLFKSNEVM